jgi:hypothetical protein
MENSLLTTVVLMYIHFFNFSVGLYQYLVTLKVIQKYCFPENEYYVKINYILCDSILFTNVVYQQQGKYILGHPHNSEEQTNSG